MAKRKVSWLKDDATLLKWGFRIVKHDKECFAIHEAFLYDKNNKLHSHCSTPLISGYTVDSLKGVYDRMAEAFNHRATPYKGSK